MAPLRSERDEQGAKTLGTSLYEEDRGAQMSGRFSGAQEDEEGTKQLSTLIAVSVFMMCLPWAVGHPQTLLVPLALAATPVIGPGFRSLVKEASGFVAGTVSLLNGSQNQDSGRPHQHGDHGEAGVGVQEYDLGKGHHPGPAGYETHQQINGYVHDRDINHYQHLTGPHGVNSESHPHQHDDHHHHHHHPHGGHAGRPGPDQVHAPYSSWPRESVSTHHVGVDPSLAHGPDEYLRHSPEVPGVNQLPAHDRGSKRRSKSKESLVKDQAGRDFAVNVTTHHHRHHHHHHYNHQPSPIESSPHLGTRKSYEALHPSDPNKAGLVQLDPRTLTLEEKLHLYQGGDPRHHSHHPQVWDNLDDLQGSAEPSLSVLDLAVLSSPSGRSKAAGSQSDPGSSTFSSYPALHLTINSAHGSSNLSERHVGSSSGVGQRGRDVAMHQQHDSLEDGQGPTRPGALQVLTTVMPLLKSWGGFV